MDNVTSTKIDGIKVLTLIVGDSIFFINDVYDVVGYASQDGKLFNCYISEYFSEYRREQVFHDIVKFIEKFKGVMPHDYNFVLKHERVENLQLKVINMPRN